MKKKHLLSMLILPLLLLCPVVEAKQIHAFIAADTLSNLKIPATIDIKTVRKMVESIADAMHIPAATYVIEKRKLNGHTLSETIQNASIASDDVVLFYYSGHGFRTYAMNNIWPNVYFTNTQEEIPVETLVGALLQKQASLYIVLADCCNNYIKEIIPQGRYLKRRSVPPKTRVRATLKNLFSQENKLILASGAVPGSLSWATEKGSIFTNALVKSLQSEAYEESPDWERVLQRTATLCRKHQKIQYLISPIWETTEVEHHEPEN